MTLATRCPACHTTFKVVKDQLRLADGWVRCGRCDEVFLAADAVALSQQPAPPSPRSADDMGALPMRGTIPEPVAPAEPARSADPQATLQDKPQAGAQALAPVTEQAVATFAEGAGVRPEADMASDPLALDQASTGQASLSEASNAAGLPEPVGEPLREPLPEPVPEPSLPARPYVWDTARAQRAPPSPWSTAAWSVLAGLGVATLVTQAALAWHDELLHAAPVLKPVLEVACVMADCRLEPVRRLQALSVESSQLSQLGGTIYQFNATVRNRSGAEVAAPALDLVLTGNDGQVIARKVLRWTDFGLRNRSMASQQEVSLQTNLNTGTTAVAGFTIELFYP